MADAKKKRPRIVSPAGSLSYAWLTTADKKYEKEFGAFKTNLVLPIAQGRPLIDQIDEQMAEHLAAEKAKVADPKKAAKITATKPPYVVDEDAGTVTFKFSTAAGGRNKETKEVWARKVALYDAKGTPIVGAIKVGSGTTAKVSFEFSPHHIPKDGPGIKLQLVAVQILKLVEYQTGTAEQFGFEAEEGFEVGAEGTEAGEATKKEEAGDSSEDF